MTTLYALFHAAAERHADRTAVSVDGRSLTYRQLGERAEALASRIATASDGIPARVALLAGRTIEAYVGYLAVQRVGAAVVPLNPDYPMHRSLDIAQRAGVRLALLGPGVADIFAQLPRRHRPSALAIGDSDSDTDNGPHASPPLPDDPEREAYLLFTSGSTGQPKGVPIKQRHIAPYIVQNRDRYEVDEQSRTSQTFGLTFDASVFDMFVAWSAGAELCVPSAAELYRPVEFMVGHRLTHWFSVPSVLRVAEQYGNLPRGQVTTVRHGLFGAEPVNATLSRLWGEVAPDAAFHNLYGPTEAAITCAQFAQLGPASGRVVASNGTVPIGAMYPTMEGVVLDDAGRPAADGELCIRGPQRFDGYLDPAENANRFLAYEPGGTAVPTTGAQPPRPEHWYRTGDRIKFENGRMVHHGRLDDQVKILGHRVELGEIEAALHRHPDIDESLVVTVTDDAGTRVHAAYTGRPVDPRQLDDWLREQLPLHMVPTSIALLEQLPLNENGKKDRLGLAAMIAKETR